MIQDTPSVAVPRLTTALTGPLLDLERHFLERQGDIERWFRQQWLETPAPFYTSVDLRNSGFKLAPVDTNLFPAGFNNLSPEVESLCVHAAQSAAERLVPDCRGVLIIPEDHTRNRFYWQSIARLVRIWELAGFTVRIGTLDPAVTEPQPVELPDGLKLYREPIERTGSRVHLGEFSPCFILLHNDLSSGFPDILANLEQPITPSPDKGWSTRRKSIHFEQYNAVASELAELLDIDPWLINPLFRHCGEIDFQKREGEDCVATNVAELLMKIKEKYERYGIDREPFMFVKADSGTYGMNIMVVHRPEEIHELNRKQRNKMARGKGGSSVTNVLVQEGVYTFETWGRDQAVAEPVVYMIDRFVVGGFYRVHTGRAHDENLNAPGMHFEPLAFAEPCSQPDRTRNPDDCANRFYAYGVVARLAALAAAREPSAAASGASLKEAQRR